MANMEAPGEPQECALTYTASSQAQCINIVTVYQQSAFEPGILSPRLPTKHTLQAPRDFHT